MKFKRMNFQAYRLAAVTFVSGLLLILNPLPVLPQEPSVAEFDNTRVSKFTNIATKESKWTTSLLVSYLKDLTETADHPLQSAELNALFSDPNWPMDALAAMDYLDLEHQVRLLGILSLTGNVPDELLLRLQESFRTEDGALILANRISTNADVGLWIAFAAFEDGSNTNIQSKLVQIAGTDKNYWSEIAINSLSLRNHYFRGTPRLLLSLPPQSDYSDIHAIKNALGSLGLAALAETINAIQDTNSRTRIRGIVTLSRLLVEPEFSPKNREAQLISDSALFLWRHNRFDSGYLHVSVKKSELYDSISLDRYPVVLSGIIDTLSNRRLLSDIPAYTRKTIRDGCVLGLCAFQPRATLGEIITNLVADRVSGQTEESVSALAFAARHHRADTNFMVNNLSLLLGDRSEGNAAALALTEYGTNAIKYLPMLAQKYFALRSNRGRAIKKPNPPFDQWFLGRVLNVVPARERIPLEQFLIESASASTNEIGEIFHTLTIHERSIAVNIYIRYLESNVTEVKVKGIDGLAAEKRFDPEFGIPTIFTDVVLEGVVTNLAKYGEFLGFCDPSNDKFFTVLEWVLDQDSRLVEPAIASFTNSTRKVQASVLERVGELSVGKSNITELNTLSLVKTLRESQVEGDSMLFKTVTDYLGITNTMFGILQGIVLVIGLIGFSRWIVIFRRRRLQLRVDPPGGQSVRPLENGSER